MDSERFELHIAEFYCDEFSLFSFISCKCGSQKNWNSIRSDIPTYGNRFGDRSQEKVMGVNAKVIIYGKLLVGIN